MWRLRRYGPQTFVEEHVWPAGQIPQERVPPHPSEMVPQFFPWAVQLVGRHGCCDFRLPIASYAKRMTGAPRTMQLPLTQVAVLFGGGVQSEFVQHWDDGMHELPQAL